MSDVLAFDRSAIDALPASAEGLLKYASAQLIIGIPASKNDGTGSKTVHTDPRWTPKHVALVASLLSNRSDLAGAPTVMQDGGEVDRQATEDAMESYLSDPARPFPLVMQAAPDGTPFAERSDFQAIIDEQQTSTTLATDKATIDGWVTEESLSDAEYQALLDDAITWEPDLQLSEGDEVADDGKLYRVIQPKPPNTFTTVAGQEPHKVPALYVQIQPVNVIGEWTQPTGAQDAYYKPVEVGGVMRSSDQGQGSYCTFEGDVWKTEIDANTDAPPTNWENLTNNDTGSSTGEWQAGVYYGTESDYNDYVDGGGTAPHGGTNATYQGTEYVILQPHESIVGWEPPNVPALWDAL